MGRQRGHAALLRKFIQWSKKHTEKGGKGVRRVRAKTSGKKSVMGVTRRKEEPLTQQHGREG